MLRFIEYRKNKVTVRPATALFLVPGIYSAIENSASGGSCYLVLCKFLQRIVLWEVRPLQ